MKLTSLTLLAAWLGALAIGCSDAPEKPAQGASFLTVQQGCGMGSRSSFTIPQNATPTSSTTQGSQVVDGPNAKVSCTVKKKGDGFRISATLTAGNRSFYVTNASVAKSSNPSYAYEGTGNIGHYAQESGSMYGNNCQITVLPNQHVRPGAVWANFLCPEFRNPSSAGSLCEASGSFLFGNCTE